MSILDDMDAAFALADVPRAPRAKIDVSPQGDVGAPARSRAKPALPCVQPKPRAAVSAVVAPSASPVSPYMPSRAALRGEKRAPLAKSPGDPLTDALRATGGRYSELHKIAEAEGLTTAQIMKRWHRVRR